MNGQSKFGGSKPGQNSTSIPRQIKSNFPFEAARNQFEYIANEEEIKQPICSKIPGFEANSSKMANQQVNDLQKRVFELEKQLKVRDAKIEHLAMENATLKAEKWIIEHWFKAEQWKVKELESRHSEPDQDFNQALMHMIMNTNIIKQEMVEAHKEEEDLLEQAIQASLQDHPNPDMMNYE